MEKLAGQKCHLCGKNTLELSEDEQEIPSLGKVFLFSMKCSSCGFSKSDLECEKQGGPVKITFATNSEKDMKVKVVKSGAAVVKLPGMRMSLDSGPDSEGFISDIGELVGRFEKVLEEERENSEDVDVKKKAKNGLKKLRKVKFGDIPFKIVIEDPSGNSAILSDKAEVSKLK